MRTLTLSVKAVYFHQIKNGEKLEEYRLVNEYWRRRLLGRKYDRLVITLGYPKSEDADRRISCAWHGFGEKTIQHEHFGPEPVRVFAINVQGAA